jgi:hypothetical protein
MLFLSITGSKYFFLFLVLNSNFVFKRFERFNLIDHGYIYIYIYIYIYSYNSYMACELHVGLRK